MHPLVALLYEGTARAARLASWLAARLAWRFEPLGYRKTRRSLAARRGVLKRWRAWAARVRDPARELLWVHAPSVGEGLQARPVIERLRVTHPDLQLAYTFFSPSAEAFARGLPVDGADYLPFDTAYDARAMVDALRPRALVFSKLDVWPVLASVAASRGVRLGLISATLAERSGRRSAIGRAVLEDAYRRLDLVGAISPEDAGRLTSLGVRESAIRVTGDTRYDQVWARAQSTDRRSELLAPLASDRPTLVAGSTWYADLIPLYEAWRAVRGEVPGIRMIVAPHEPREAYLGMEERWADARGIRCARLGAADAGAADLVLVDRVGVLGDLYALAHVAYVGGGFHAAGLHSVLEPAAFGVPVLFGPRHRASRDAGMLLACGGGASVRSAGDLCLRLVEWLGSPAAAARAGDAAREMVRAGLGAAERSAALVTELLLS